MPPWMMPGLVYWTKVLFHVFQFHFVLSTANVFKLQFMIISEI